MIRSLKGIRGILALCIFISHLTFLKNTEFEGIYSEYLVGFGAYAVLFFFILSGFGIGCGYSKKFNNIFKKETLTFYKKRILTLYPAHIIILLLGIYFNWNYISSHGAVSIKEIIINMLLLCGFTETRNFNGLTWYLSVLLICYLLTPIIIW